MSEKKGLTHHGLRKLVCLVCGLKKKNSVRPLQNQEKVWLNSYWLRGLSYEDPRLPNSICTNCRYALQGVAAAAEGKSIPEKSKGRLLPPAGELDFTQILKGPVTKTQSELMSKPGHDCPICKLGRQNLSPGNPKDRRARSAGSFSRSSIPQICGNCGIIYGQGQHHACSRGQMASNLMHSLPKSVRQQVACATIREAMQEASTSTVQLKNTVGKAMTVTSQSRIAKPSACKELFTSTPAEVTCHPCTGARNKVRTGSLASQSSPDNANVKGSQKSSVPSGDEQVLVSSMEGLNLLSRRKLISSQLDPEESPSEPFLNPYTNKPYMNQFPEPSSSPKLLPKSSGDGEASLSQAPQMSASEIAHIMARENLSMNQMRRLQHDIRQKFGTKAVEQGAVEKVRTMTHSDDQFFKLTYAKMSMSGKETKTCPVVHVRDVTDFIQYCHDRRNLAIQDTELKVGFDGGQNFLKVGFSIVDLGSVHSGGKSSSIDDVFILGIVPDVPENYHNVKAMWDLCQLDDIRFCLCSDLKMTNIIFGLQSYSALHPCYVCEAQNPKRSADDWISGEARTLGSIRQNVMAFRNSGAQWSKAKEFKNCVAMPLPKDQPETKTLSLAPIMELHLVLGIVTHLYKALHKAWEQAAEWLKHLHVTPRAYHGGEFTGNDCRELLKKKSLDELEKRIPGELLQFVKVLRSFSEVVASCFSTHLSSDFNEKIASFRTEYLKLGLSVIPKAHMVFVHIGDFYKLGTFKKVGLGVYSEQAFEALHRDFLKVWRRYEVSPLNPRYGSSLLKAVQFYNSCHQIRK